LSPPRDLSDIIKDPIQVLVYSCFVMAACGLFARYWVDISGESSKDIAKKFKD